MPRFGWFFGMILRVSLISHVDIRCPLHGGNECNTATYWTVPPSSCTCSCCVCGNSCCRASTCVRRDYSVACWLCHVCGRSQALPPVGPDSRPVYNQTYSVTETSQVLTADQSTTKHTVSQRLHRSWQPTSQQPNIQCHRDFTGPDSRPVYNQTYSVTGPDSRPVYQTYSVTGPDSRPVYNQTYSVTGPDSRPVYNQTYSVTGPDSRPVYNQTYSVTGPDSRPVYNQTYSVTGPDSRPVYNQTYSVTGPDSRPVYNQTYSVTGPDSRPVYNQTYSVTGPDSRPVYNQTYSVTETSQVLTADQSTTKHTVSQVLTADQSPTKHTVSQRFTDPDSRPVYNQTYSVTGTSQVLTADQSTTKHTVSQRRHRSWQPTSLQPNMQCHRDVTDPDSRPVYNQTYSVTETSQILTADQSTTKHTVSQRLHRSWEPTSLQPNIQSHRDVTDPDSRPVYNQTYSVTETSQILTADQSTTKHTVSQRLHRSWEPTSLQPNIQSHRDVTDPDSRPVYNQTYRVTETSQILTADQSTTKHTESQRRHRSWQPTSLQPNIQSHRDFTDPDSRPVYNQTYRVTETSQILTADQSTTKHSVTEIYRSWQPTSLQPNIQCHRYLQILTADQSTTKHTVSQGLHRSWQPTSLQPNIQSHRDVTDPDSRPVYNQTYSVTETFQVLTIDQPAQ